MLGPTGVGKSFVACALGQKACRDGYSALYTRAQSLFRDLVLTFGIKVTYLVQAAGANRLSAILARRV